MGDGGRAERRSYERSAGGTASWDSERPDRSDRARERDDAGPRMSSGGWERPRGSQRDDDMRSSGRGGRRYDEDDTWGSDGGRSGGSTGRGRPPRERRDDRADDRSMRNARPPVRGDGWDGRDRRAGPGAPVSRGGATPRGGLWDDAESPRRRPDASDPRARNGSRMDPRDPRAPRRGLADARAYPAPPAKESGLSLGKSLLIILLMFVIGAGAAYGYFRISTPKVHVSSPGTPTAAPATATPAVASPSASPHSNVPAAYPLYVVL